MADINETTCCGLMELYGLSDNTPGNLVLIVANHRFEQANYGNKDEYGYCFVLFTDVSEKDYGPGLVKYIKKNKLGKVIQTSSKRNPNTGHRIRAWIWEINQAALWKVYRKND